MGSGFPSHRGTARHGARPLPVTACRRAGPVPPGTGRRAGRGGPGARPHGQTHWARTSCASRRPEPGLLGPGEKMALAWACQRQDFGSGACGTVPRARGAASQRTGCLSAGNSDKASLRKLTPTRGGGTGAGRGAEAEWPAEPPSGGQGGRGQGGEHSCTVRTRSRAWTPSHAVPPAPARLRERDRGPGRHLGPTVAPVRPHPEQALASPAGLAGEPRCSRHKAAQPGPGRRPNVLEV